MNGLSSPRVLAHPSKPWRHHAALAVVALAALLGGAARMGTADWGLPYAFHPDERGFVVWEGLYMEWRGLVHEDARPRINTYGPLVLETVVAMKWLFMGGPEHARTVAEKYDSAWAYVEGAFGHPPDAPFSWPRLYLLLRILSGLLGTTAIVLLAVTAERLEGPRAAAYTAVLAAASVGLIQGGHYYTAEAWVLFALSLLLHASALLATTSRRAFGPAVYAGVALGLVAATKLPGLVALPLVPLAIALSGSARTPEAPHIRLLGLLKGSLRALVSARFLLAVGVGALILLCLNPWLFVDTHAYFYDVTPNRSGLWHMEVHLPQTEFDFYDWRFTYNDTVPFLYHLTHVLPYALGTPLLLVALAGLFRGLLCLRPLHLFALVIAVPPFLLIGTWGVKTIRYTLPMVPGLLLGAATLLSEAPRDKRWAAVANTVGLSVAGYTVLYGLAFTLMFTEPDSRIAAAHFLAERAAPGDLVVTEPEASYTAPLGENFGLVGTEPGFTPKLGVRRLWTGKPMDEDVLPHTEDMLRGARFLILGDFYIRKATHESAAIRAPAQRRFYDDVRSERTEFRRVATFRRSPHLGPLVWPEDDAEVLSTAFDHMGVEVYERASPEAQPSRDLPARDAEHSGLRRVRPAHFRAPRDEPSNAVPVVE